MFHVKHNDVVIMWLSQSDRAAVLVDTTWTRYVNLFYKGLPLTFRNYLLQKE